MELNVVYASDQNIIEKIKQYLLDESDIEKANRLLEEYHYSKTY